MTIKQHREAVGLTQENIAAIFNIDRSTVAKWEIGTTKPRTDMLPALAKVLKCTVDALFDESGE